MVSDEKAGIGTRSEATEEERGSDGTGMGDVEFIGKYRYKKRRVTLIGVTYRVF